MNKYESIIIINPSVDEEKVKELTTKFTDMINKDGKVEKADNLGKKKLAYPVKKNAEGYYVVLYVTANPSIIAELERKYRITDDVIKFMTKEIEEISTGGLYERWLKQNPNNSLEKLGYKRRLEKNLWDEEKGEYVPGMVWYKPNLSLPFDTFNPEELFYACVDCGKVFLRNSNSQVRCEECNAIHRKKYKAQKEKERRAKKKLNK